MMATLKLPQKTEAATAAEAAPISDNPDRNIERLAPTPQLNPRTEVLKGIAERRAIQADEEAAETLPTMNEDGSITPAETPPPPPEAPTEPAAPSEPPKPSNPAPEVAEPVVAAAKSSFDPEQEYDLTINGQQVKVKGSQILETGKAALQKDMAADYKLKVASQLLEEVQMQRKALEKPAVAEKSLDEVAAELAQTIQFGTAEQAAMAIKQLLSPKENSQQDFTKLAADLPKVVSDQIAFQDAQQFVQTEYGDLMSDPDLRALFFMKENVLRDGKDSRPYKELYKVIGEEIRTKFNRPKVASTTETAPSKTMAQKQAAKAAAPAAPRLASARMETAEAEKPKTPSEIIAAMNKRRGMASGRDLH